MPRVAVFGTLTHLKGADVLVEMARLGARRGLLIEWHAFGSLFSTTTVPSIKTHQAYSVEEMPSLLEQHLIVAAVFPSIIPETFSFVAEELASMAVPFSAFPLGAPHERFGGDRLVFFAKSVTPDALLVATLDAIEAGWERFSSEHSPRPERVRASKSMRHRAPE